MVGSTVEDRPHYWMVRVSGCAEDTTAAVLVVHKGGGEVVRIQ
jgi:hypothetical protein